MIEIKDHKKAIVAAIVATVIAGISAFNVLSVREWLVLIKEFPVVISVLFTLILFGIVGWGMWAERRNCERQLKNMRSLFYPVLQANVRDGDLPISEDQFLEGEFEAEDLEPLIQRRAVKKHWKRRARD